MEIHNVKMDFYYVERILWVIYVTQKTNNVH